MDVLGIVFVLLLGIGLLLGAGYLAYIGIAVAAAILFGFWPAIIGISLGVLLGTLGHTDAGVMVVLAGIVGTVLWLRKGSGSSDSSGSSEPYRKTLYNKDGEPIGYVDE